MLISLAVGRVDRCNNALITVRSNNVFPRTWCGDPRSEPCNRAPQLCSRGKTSARPFWLQSR